VSRGSALIEVLVIGALLTLGIGQAAVAAGRLHAAGERATEAAQAAAVWAARHGHADDAESTARAMAPDADAVTVVRRPDEFEVTVRIRVDLLGSAGPTVVGRSTARISTYRSNR
jgi:hypothetical protein